MSMEPLNIFKNSRFAFIGFEFHVECVCIFSGLLLLLLILHIPRLLVHDFFVTLPYFFHSLSCLIFNVISLFSLLVSCPSFTKNLNDYVPSLFRFGTRFCTIHDCSIQIWQKSSRVGFLLPLSPVFMLTSLQLPTRCTHVQVTCTHILISNFGQRKRVTLTLHQYNV